MGSAYIAMPTFSESDSIRFWSKGVLTANPDTCWNWVRFKDKDGYGFFTINSLNLRTNRVAYFLHNNIDPKDNFVCHSCDNPSCINPSHLFLGTPNDNVQDMVKKGRQAKGDNNGVYTHPEKRGYGLRNGAYTKPGQVRKGDLHGMSKLTSEDVLAIREIFSKKNTTTFKLAEDYKVSVSTIRNILSRRNWKHI